LPWFEKSDGVDLVGRKAPSDAVFGVNPNLIGQERQRLMSHVTRLRAYLQLPGLGADCLRKNDRGT